MFSKPYHSTENAKESLLPAAAIRESMTKNERFSLETQNNGAAENGETSETIDTEEGDAWNTVMRRRK